MNTQHFDLIVIGSGPAGQKAAIQAASQNMQVALIERDKGLGGSCVYRGTVPSKTLRENALRVNSMRLNAQLSQFKLREDTELEALINRLNTVLTKHDTYMRKQIARTDVKLIHGRAKFISNTQLEVARIQQDTLTLTASHIIIASGSHPRTPDNIPIDHENLLDSDSILSMMYIPKSLTVLGGGVIASEYATIFQALGTKVTMIDKYPSPLGFLDDDLTAKFTDEFDHMGGTWLGESTIARCEWNGIDAVEVELDCGNIIRSEKLLCAAGRVANVDHLCIENAGLSLNKHGVIDVDNNLKTKIDNIYAAGDVIGPPSLASASMEQGRRASCNALGLRCSLASTVIPSGIYSIPELSSVGLSEMQARKEYDNIIIGKADFDEIARGQISDVTNGLLKIVVNADDKKVLGVMIVGEGATELIHIGQMAIINHAQVDTFVETTFNFPTFAEAYRVAALDATYQLTQPNR